MHHFFYKVEPNDRTHSWCITIWILVCNITTVKSQTAMVKNSTTVQLGPWSPKRGIHIGIEKHNIHDVDKLKLSTMQEERLQNQLTSYVKFYLPGHWYSSSQTNHSRNSIKSLLVYIIYMYIYIYTKEPCQHKWDWGYGVELGIEQKLSANLWQGVFRGNCVWLNLNRIQGKAWLQQAEACWYKRDRPQGTKIKNWYHVGQIYKFYSYHITSNSVKKITLKTWV